MSTTQTSADLLAFGTLQRIVASEDSKAARVRQPANRLVIFDDSGSMAWCSRQMYVDFKGRLGKYPEGDIVSIGHFSSTGEFGWIVKGHVLGVNREGLYSLLDAHRPVHNLTCFSNILADVQNVISDLVPLSTRFSLEFMTDGHPCPGGSAEEKAIHVALSVIADKLSSSIFIGYGDYYNRQLMAEMAQWTGGVLVHAANLQQMWGHFEKYEAVSLGASGLAVTVEPHILHHGAIAFTTAGGQVATYTIVDGQVRVPKQKGKDTVVWVYTPPDAGGLHSKRPVPAEFFPGVYGLAVVLNRANRTDSAIEVLGTIGDVHFINQLVNAFTVEEYGAVETALATASGDETWRFIDGRKMNYIPARDAFCVLDALDLLGKDPDARFHPRHPSFDYKRIGVPRVPDEKYPKFNADPSSNSRMNLLVWNETRMNLGINVTVSGHIDLPAEEAAQVGLPSRYDTFQIRTYTLIRDGVLNVKVLPVSMSRKSFETLKEQGVVQSSARWQPGGIYPVALDVLPLINRDTAENYLSANALGMKYIELVSQKAFQKVIKNFIHALDPDKEERSKTDMPADQQAYLTEMGVRFPVGDYAPPTTAGEASDHYVANTFRVKMKGECLPSVDDIQARVAAGKLPGGHGPARMAEAVELYKDSTLEELTQALDLCKARLAEQTRYINRAKFAVLLGKRWFAELPTRGDTKLKVSNADIEFVLGAEDVAF